jgi:Na+-translocating ferredoxin:NAD+ oxidoreductase RnfD subunit
MSGPLAETAGPGTERLAPPPLTPTLLTTPPRSDPRLHQIGALGGLLVYGIGWLDLEVRPDHAVAMLLTALLTQYAWTRIEGLPRFDPRSALISGLSLCLLLRTNWTALAVTAAVIAISSKFLLRVRGKHVFNPTNLALVAMIAATGLVWVSPGQWGSTAVFGFLLACVGGLVVNRAARSDVTLVFLLTWSAIVLGRSLWLDEPLAIPLHRLQNGALILFSFFMISDPKTTPDSRTGRVLFAMLVALGAAVVQFGLYRPNGLLWSLAVCSAAVPLIDRLLPGRRYDWRAPRGLPAPEPRRPGAAAPGSPAPPGRPAAPAGDRGSDATATRTPRSEGRLA